MKHQHQRLLANYILFAILILFVIYTLFVYTRPYPVQFFDRLLSDKQQQLFTTKLAHLLPGQMQENNHFFYNH